MLLSELVREPIDRETTMTGTLSTCRCQHCPQVLEFEPKRAGEMVPCPNCGMDTCLFLGGVAAQPAATKSATAPSMGLFGRDKRVERRLEELSARPAGTRKGAWLVVLFCLIGIVLVLV